MSMSRQDADDALRRALGEIEALPIVHRPGHAPLEAIYRASAETLRAWVYAEGLEGRALQGREELLRRDSINTLRAAQLTLVVSVIALAVSVILAFTN